MILELWLLNFASHFMCIKFALTRFPALLALSYGWDDSPKITARYVISKSNEQIRDLCILNIVISNLLEVRGFQFPGRL